MTSRPLCKCHGEPMYWHKDKRRATTGGAWRCAVKVRAHVKRYVEQNQEKLKAYRRKRYRENVEGFRIYNAKHYQEHKEEIKAKVRAYYQALPEERKREAERRSRERYRDIYAFAYRARRFAADPFRYSTRERLEARIALYGGRCYYCGAEADTKDHRIPLIRGGLHLPANIVPACKSCNSRKRDLTELEFKNGVARTHRGARAALVEAE